MKQVLSCILGFLSVVVILAFFGTLSSVLLPALWSSLLAKLTLQPSKATYTFILGCTLGLEGLTTRHFGLMLIFASLLLIIQTIFTDQLRFTSLVARFNLANCLILILYTLLFSNYTSFQTWLVTGTIALLAVLGSYGYTSLSRHASPSFT